MKKKAAGILMALIFIISSGTTVMAKDVKQPEKAKPQNYMLPSGICLKKDGVLLVTDVYNNMIWSQKGKILTPITARPTLKNADGTPLGGYTDSVYASAQFESPWAIAPFLNGYAVTDTENHVVRFLDGTKVLTIAGTGKPDLINGNGIKSAFNRPTGLAADNNGNLYVSDTGNNVIRKIDKNGEVTIFAGGKAGCKSGTLKTSEFREPTGLCWSGNALYVADTGNHRIVKIANGVVTTIAGKIQTEGSDAFFGGGYTNGSAHTAEFSAPQGIAVSGKTVYIADTGNSSVRKLADGKVTTILERKKTDDTFPVSPRSLAIMGEKLIISDVFSGLIFNISI